MSFLNINKQAQKKATKDIANIRLMGSNVQNKYNSQIFENNLREKQIVFGGYTSALAQLTTGYAQKKYYS
jgi:RecA/RadA recombinase